MVLEKWPVMMSSWCLAYRGCMISLSSAAISKHLILEGLSRRSIMPVMPPCLSASVIVSHPYWMSLDA